MHPIGANRASPTGLALFVEELMQAHDYIEDNGACIECLRGPGDYLHIGLSDEQMEARDWHRSLPEHAVYELTDTPAVLRQLEQSRA